MSLVRTLFSFILAIALTAFAVSNRQSAPLIYSPIHEPLDVPLYLIALLFMAGGFVLGAVAAWMNGGKTRKIKRQQRKTIKALEKELGALSKDKDKADAPPSEFFPALPKGENSSIKQG